MARRQSSRTSSNVKTNRGKFDNFVDAFKNMKKTSNRNKTAAEKRRHQKALNKTQEAMLKQQVEAMKVQNLKGKKQAKNPVNHKSKEVLDYELQKAKIDQKTVLGSEAITSTAGLAAGGMATGHDIASANNGKAREEQLVNGGMTGDGQFGRDPVKPDKPVTEYSLD